MMAEGSVLGNETEDLPTSPIGRQPSVTLGVPGVPSSRVGAHAWHYKLLTCEHIGLAGVLAPQQQPDLAAPSVGQANVTPGAAWCFECWAFSQDSNFTC